MPTAPPALALFGVSTTEVRSIGVVPKVYALAETKTASEVVRATLKYNWLLEFVPAANLVNPNPIFD